MKKANKDDDIKKEIDSKDNLENKEKKLKEKEKEKEKTKKENVEEEEDEEEKREKKNLEKFRINFLSFKTSLPKTTLKSLCPLCIEIPDINLSSKDDKKLYVKCKKCRYCYCCSNPKSKTLDDYISIMAKIQQDNIKCDIHKIKGIDEEGYFSCEYCQKWMCEQCINEHIQKNNQHNYYVIRKVIKNKDMHTHCPRHNLKEYSYYVLEEFMLGFHICKDCKVGPFNSETDVIRIPIEKGVCYINQLKEIIKKGVEYLDIYCQNIYNHLIKSIKNNPELLKIAKEIYDNFLIRNRRVLFYYQMAINAATPSIANYNLINNISALLLTKFEKINIPLTKIFNKDEIDKTLNFFEYNYIVGKEEKKMEDLNEFNIKEISTIKKKEKTSNKKNNIEKNKKDEDDSDDSDKNKTKYIDIIVFNQGLVCACTEDGYVDIFNIDKPSFSGKYILSQKVHEKKVVALDIIKKEKNKFITCDENNIKIWKIDIINNKLSCETTLKELSKSILQILFVLNNSNISIIDEENNFIILDSSYKKIFLIDFDYNIINGLYQIESNDENNNKLIIGGEKKIVLFNPFEKDINKIILNSINCGCFSGKSFYYMGNDKLILGKDDIYIVDIKELKLEYIINVGSAEITCFFKFNDIIICGYGDTTRCHSWTNGIACDKTTKFCGIKKNKEKYESILISNDFYEFGITNSIWIDKDKFITCFYEDNCLKIFQIK